MSDELLKVEVAFALPTKQSIMTVHVSEGTSIEACIKASGILEEYPEIDLANNKVGIWSRTKKLSDTIKLGDRIEIYRPLIADPKEIRRLRAEKAKEEGRANKITGAKKVTK
ncbi:RnfH family protein [Catenovulum maritimum]|uniref:UPF0125 protein XM47_09010 n=1 Tax=Catenovulum maritimum TaxID=1513271 RepID=A0A0J8GRN7_9ALTE|nr:RnfH family protein [Catenovulum maritimum]KMT65480.1 protein RnfH [Catenovulum maritimum]